VVPLFPSWFHPDVSQPIHWENRCLSSCMSSWARLHAPMHITTLGANHSGIQIPLQYLC
jgi:hypothetical protein